MKKVIAGLLVAAGLVAAGCSTDASKADLEQPQVDTEVANEAVHTEVPDDITVWVNLDKHANIARVCIDGLAFLSVSTAHQSESMPAVQRFPDWDADCPGE